MVDCGFVQFSVEVLGDVVFGYGRVLTVVYEIRGYVSRNFSSLQVEELSILSMMRKAQEESFSREEVNLGNAIFSLKESLLWYIFGWKRSSIKMRHSVPQERGHKSLSNFTVYPYRRN